jgi:uncharacterized protein YndB with AHSA1/START domain/catechol 2,3-dioxygenase-like lactoylglutathione lyase family enzyme
MRTASSTSSTTFTTPSDVEVVATRVFDAPRWLVWEAWTDPQHLPHWMLGPDGWTMPVCELDLRPGGRWRFVWHGPDGAEMEMTGEYRTIEAPERLVSTESWGDGWPETVNTLTLHEEDGRTTITQRTEYPSIDARDAALRTGMADGMSASFDRLAGYLIDQIPPGADPSVAMKLELVPIPVADIDRSRAFYQERLGFGVDVDTRPAPGVRIVQLTPHASSCSILLASGLPDVEMPVGSQRGLHLVVADIEQARAALVERGLEMGDVVDVGRGVKYAAFADPDGNTWTLQEMAWRSGDF